MKIEILTDTGFHEISKTVKSERNETLARLTLNTGEVIECTFDHGIFCPDLSKKQACDFRVGDGVMTKAGVAYVKSWEIVAPKPVYDVVNAGPDHRFYANDILVANCDEAAFIKQGDAFFKAIRPVISSGKSSKIILTSTPNGKKGEFYRAVSKGKKGQNSYFIMSIPWFMVPGRDAEWKKKTVENDGSTAFRQEYNCVAGETLVTIRNDDTGEVMTMPIAEAYAMMEKAEASE